MIDLKTTRIRSLTGEQLIFSIADLLQSGIRNYKRMDERRVQFRLGVTYQTPAALLARIPAIVRGLIERAGDVRVDRAHFAAFGKMPGKILDPQKLIASTRTSLLKSLSATLESEEPRPGELPSTRLLFRSDAAWFRARFTVDNDRLDQLLYVGRSEEQRSAPAVAAMFDSFHVLAATDAQAGAANAGER